MKRALTLLEVVIALALTAILLSVLLSFYRQIAFSNLEAKEAKQRILYREWTQEKLTQVFSTALDSEEDEEGYYTLSVADGIGTALAFGYDNGIDSDPNYCDKVRAALYLNAKKELCLITWPDRKQILYTGVQSIHFSFFDLNQLTWRSDWTKEDGLPEMLKITLYEAKYPKQPIEFAYFLPAQDQQIPYAPKKIP